MWWALQALRKARLPRRLHEGKLTRFLWNTRFSIFSGRRSRRRRAHLFGTCTHVRRGMGQFTSDCHIILLILDTASRVLSKKWDCQGGWLILARRLVVFRGTLKFPVTKDFTYWPSPATKTTTFIPATWESAHWHATSANDFVLYLISTGY